MIGPLAALVRCARAVRRAVAPAPLTGLTMDQAARILAPRPRLLRRAIALGCPAAALPTAAVPPVAGAGPVPLPPIPGALPMSAPLPFGIGTGPLLPPVLPGDVPLPVQFADVAAAVPEPTTLSLLLVGLFVAAVVRLT